MRKPRRMKIKATKIITIVLLATVIAVVAAGCGEAGKKELSFRNSYKKIWDKTAVDVEIANKKIKAAYEAGDVDAVVAAYKDLAAKYDKARTEVAKLDTPSDYVQLDKAMEAYLTYGAKYSNEIAKVVDETGGNYGEAQSGGLKATEKKWAAATKKAESEMKTMRFTLQ